MMVTDEELMTRVQGGEAEAFTILARRHKPWLTGLLYHLFWDREEAADGAQEVLLRLWQARRDYRPTASLKTYLFTIARNYWHNRSTRVLRKQRAVSLNEEFGPGARSILEQLADENATPEQQVIQSYEVFRLRQAVDRLPEKQRLVFILSHYGDMRYREIAGLLGIPEGTVKSRMAAAVTTLRRTLA